MSFDKQYPNRKDRRKPYPKSPQRCDRTCRVHGSCKWCARNRGHSTLKRDVASKEQLHLDREDASCSHAT